MWSMKKKIFFNNIVLIIYKNILLCKSVYSTKDNLNNTFLWLILQIKNTRNI